ncbi:MAG: phosphate ABC transporter permease subunit PstC [Acidimicrobiales bacterium]|nr:phosphate ABC transporter permease subunit PstC [Acidimicrobiales bacterium]
MATTLNQTTSSASSTAAGRPFPLWRRGVTATIEAVLYLLLALLVAITEYFVAGPIGDVGLSNWWIAAILYAALEGYCWPSGQTLAMRLMGSSAQLSDGSFAGPLRMATRQLIRFLIVYAAPLWAFDFNVWRIVVIAVGVAVMIEALDRAGTGAKAPWDFFVGSAVVEGGIAGVSPDLAPVRSVTDLRLAPGRAAQNERARKAMFAAGLSSVVVSVLIVLNIFTEAWAFVSDQEFSWGLLTDVGWFPRRGQFDLSTLFVGTLWVTIIAMVVAGPVGIGVAFYLSEYAGDRTQRIVKPLIETLASIPSVVLGLFAISFIFPKILQPIFADIGIFSLLAAGLGVGVLTVPIVASISEDAMRAVPTELREASYGLGARKATTALRVVFPAAISGISAALIVGVSRAIGETMVVFIAAGGSGGALFESDPTEPGQTLTAAMASVGAGTDSVAGSGIAFQSLYFLGALLFLATLLLNVASDFIVRRFRQVY